MSFFYARILSIAIAVAIVFSRKANNAKLPVDVPNFFLIGAGKCGSTSLFELITEHPEVCKSTQKEFHYFGSDRYGYTDAGKLWYTQSFANTNLRECAEGKYTIDGTPRYIRLKEAAQHVASAYSVESLKKKKFILILREPVAREFSWYRHRMRSCLKTIKRSARKAIVKYDEKKGINVYDKSDICNDPTCPTVGCKSMPADENVEKTAQSHLAPFPAYADKYMEKYDSEYASQIKEWLKYIRRDQLFILNGQTLYEDTDDTMNRLSTFLGLKHDWGVNVTVPSLNVNYVEAEFPCKLFDKLEAYYQPHNEALYALMAAGGGPATEPPFPKFTSSRKICTDANQDKTKKMKSNVG
jgi:hypothetical protein